MRTKVLTILITLSISVMVFGQKKITGTVIDNESNEPLPGVSIVEKGTSNGVVSDFDGNYEISVSENGTLQFAYLGFVKQEQPVNGRSVIDIGLVVDLSALDEVVVVGYGTQKKSDLTGAISVVDIDEVNKSPVATIDQALQGQVAGVDVTANSGRPGGEIMVRIRGIGTLNNSSPLYVVDGMMVNDIAFLNAGDIESMQVLKDASATSIYGSRGSNGVVIITTKKGGAESKISINTYGGFQNFWRSTNVLDAPTWGALRNEAMVASGLEPGIDDPQSLQTTNWFDEISQHDAFISSTDISASGGGDKGGYFLSGSYFTQEGTIKKTNYDRVTLRANTTHEVKPWLTVGENLSLSRSRSKSIGEGDEWTSAIITSIAADPASPVRNPDGTFARGVYNDTWNPAAILAFTNNNFSSYRTLGNIFAHIKLNKHFTIKSNYSAEYTFSQSSDYNPIYAVGPVQKNSVRTLTVGNSNLLISQWSNTLNYEQNFGDHHVTGLVGVETYNYTSRFTTATANNLPSDDIDIRFLDNASGNNQAAVRGSRYEVAQLSYLGRVNYDYKDKYLFTANVRGDASSKFSKKNRWGYFPSFSAGWKISNEKFMESLTALDHLKLRVGWGKIGNQGSVPAYQDVTTANTGSNYLWGGVLAPGSAFPGSGNDEIKWETSTTLNFGLDFRFLKGKLSGSIDYYDKETTDMLLQVPVPGQTGIQSPPTQNAGSMKNTGIELALNYKNYESEFKYSAGLVFSKTDNEVVDLGSAGAFIDGASFFNSYYVTRTTAGKPIAQFYGFKTNGLFQNQAEIDAQTAQKNVAPGDVRYVDANNDGELDFFYLGSPLPDFTYGFNTNFMYKGFDLTINLQGVQGNKIFNGTSQYKRSSTGVYNLGRDMVNRWIGEGTQNDARYPRMNFNDVNNSRMSDRFIEDGSYLRIKTVQLGYSVSEKTAKKIGFERLKLYGNVQNLFTFTNYSGLDPEVGMRSGDPLDLGVDRGLYPQPRTFTLGLNVSF